MTNTTTRTVSTIAALALAVGLAACSDDGGTAELFADEADASEADTLGACTRLLGQATDDILDGSCTDEAGGTVILVSIHFGCPDGRRLVWNDYGWGYTGGTWQSHTRPDKQLLPPDPDMAACNDPWL